MPDRPHKLFHYRYGATTGLRNLTIALILAFLVFFNPSRLAAAEITIAALGDSLVHGYGLPPEDGFVAQMQRWLDANGVDVRLINAGVSGDTTAGGLARIDWTLTPDVDAVVVSLGANDALRGIDPDTARSNLDGILAAATAKSLPVLLVGIQAPGNFGEPYKASFESNYPELAEKYDVLLYPNFIGALTQAPDFTDTLTQYFQADRLHPNASGVAEIVADMGPSVMELVALAAR